MKRFRNILVAVDPQNQRKPALEWAAVLAEHNRARLKLVDVLPDFSWPVWMTLPDPEHTRELILRERRELLEVLASPLRAKGLEVTTCALSGKSSVEIIREVLRDGHDLVVRVSKGAGSPAEGYFGNTTSRLLRNCPCPVWAVEPDSEPRFARVLAAVDPVPHDEDHAQLNRMVMELAQSVAVREEGELHVMHVWSLFGESVLSSHVPPEDFEVIQSNAEAEATGAFDRFLADFGLSVAHENVHLVKGEPVRAINGLIQEKDIDLLVLGTVGRTGVSAMVMGNTAEMVLDAVHCAVLAVKPRGFVSPVTL
jgi:universal stress protein E